VKADLFSLKRHAGGVEPAKEQYYDEKFNIIYDIKRGAIGDKRVFCVKEGDVIMVFRNRGGNRSDGYALVNFRLYEVVQIKKRAKKIVCKLISDETNKVRTYICEPQIVEEFEDPVPSNC